MSLEGDGIKAKNLYIIYIVINIAEHPEFGRGGDLRITKDRITRMLRVAEDVLLVHSNITLGCHGRCASLADLQSSSVILLGTELGTVRSRRTNN